MEPETLIAILGGVALVITSVGGMIAAIMGARRSAAVLEKASKIEVKTEAIEHATNGAATTAAADKRTLIEKVGELEKQLRNLAADRLTERETSRQAAADVRAERATLAPSAGPREGRP